MATIFVIPVMQNNEEEMYERLTLFICALYPIKHCKDKIVNQVSLVLRMLYLSDFRDLQTEINSLLMLVQECTANP